MGEVRQRAVMFCETCEFAQRARWEDKCGLDSKVEKFKERAPDDCPLRAGPITFHLVKPAPCPAVVDGIQCEHLDGHALRNSGSWLHEGTGVVDGVKYKVQWHEAREEETDG